MQNGSWSNRPLFFSLQCFGNHEISWKSDNLALCPGSALYQVLDFQDLKFFPLECEGFKIYISAESVISRIKWDYVF